jgi:hypothetical protein
MIYKVVKRFEKTNDQDWSGIYYSVSSSLDSTPDDRDAAFSILFSDIKDKSTNYINSVRSMSGYIGNRRIYESNNVLKIIDEFDSLESASQLFLKFTSNTASPTRVLVQAIAEKIQNNVVPFYTITKTLEDSDGNILSPTN